MIEILEQDGNYYTRISQVKGLKLKDCITHENSIMIVGDIKSWWEEYERKVRQNFRKLRLRRYVEFENKNIICLNQDEYIRTKRAANI